MRLAFNTIAIEHFRSFTKRQEFVLDPSVGLWFLRGENLVEPQLGANGAGKSSIWDALCWVLYGRTAKGLKNPDVKPWVGKGVPRVTLTITRNGKKHVVERAAKTNGLTIDGKEVDSGASEEWAQLPFDVFVNTLYLAQGLPLFFDRTPREKMELFAKVLPLEKWEERSTRAAKRVRELEDLSREMTGELSGLKMALDQSAKHMKVSQEMALEWDATKEKERLSAKGKIASSEAELVALQRELDAADLIYDGCAVKLREMREDAKTLRKEAATAQRQYDDEIVELRVVTRDLERAKQELAELASAKNCPTCGQPIVKKNINEHRLELAQRVDDIERKHAKGVNKKIKKQYDDAAEQLASFERELAATELDADKAQTRVNTLQPEVQRLKATLLLLQDAQRTADERNPHQEQIANLRKQKKLLETKIEELEEDSLKAEKQIERTKFWVKGFKDVALYLIEEVLTELEAVTNATLGEVGLVGWEVQYAMERETKSGTTQRGITVTVVPPEDYIPGGKVVPIKWESWSGGEEQRLRLVGAIALSDVLLRHAGIQANLEVFDEPAKYISGAGVSDLCRYLKDRARGQDKTIWLIDHMVEESAVFAGTVVVQKTEHGSVISDGA